MSITMSGSWGSWEESDYASFLLWDIDREFQNAYEAYEQWLARNRRRRSAWQCITGSTQEDALGKALSLGRHVQKLIDDGKEAFGSRFERGDCKENPVLQKSESADADHQQQAATLSSQRNSNAFNMRSPFRSWTAHTLVYDSPYPTTIFYGRQKVFDAHVSMPCATSTPAYNLLLLRLSSRLHASL